MSNLGFLNLTLKDVRKQQADDPETRVTAIRLDFSSTQIGSFKMSFPPGQRLELPAFPQARNLVCEVMPKRYRHCKTTIFSLTDGEDLPIDLTVLRNPKEWRASFVPWNQLSTQFDTLKTILEISQIKVIKGLPIGKFTGDDYNKVNGDRAIIAKAAMLNIFTKMMLTAEPIGSMHPWFSFVRQILAIDRERFFAIVDPEMGEIVKHILQNIDKFDDYEEADHSQHVARLEKNLPEFHFIKDEIRSVKTDERHANLQLTMAPARDASGKNVLLLDVDIDENGDLLNHLIDVALLHPIKGGTHPFDIHEFMLLSDDNLDFGYKLV
ncbi:MAG: hypothetical protein L0226_18215 [Acidobacteria bacterium]|nr:hypothetical protein [Acidobacteriota bacterium]MCI0660069.1 hypothetical protein [Acidobacteriota bacterium]